ncbi:MAG: EFR1 family ferrodoxin [Treponema sp.]|nr:EFR1 family ferrodoxin [Treponema sp.]
MKLLFCYYSGTGHTKRIVDLYKKSFEQNDASVDAHNIENAAFPFNVADYDAIGFFYPVYAFNAPWFMVDFIASLPAQVVPKNCFIAASSGEPLVLNFSSRSKIQTLLKKRNFCITNHYNYVMPYNIMFRHTDERAYAMIETAKQLVPLDVQEIISGKSVVLHLPMIFRFISFVFRIEFWGGRFNGTFYRTTDACTKCGLCIKKCPVHNIAAASDGKPVFGKNCLMCQRCSMYCPTDAIIIGLFNSWKVHGRYTFKKPSEAEVDTHPFYLSASYKRYFKKAAKRIAEANEN